MLENSATVLKTSTTIIYILSQEDIEKNSGYLFWIINSVVKNRALNNAMIMAVFFFRFQSTQLYWFCDPITTIDTICQTKKRKNWFTSQRSLTFLDPATKASFSSTILWDNLNLTVARSGSVEDGSRPRLLRLPPPDVFMGFDMGEGGERPWWLRARTTKITVLEAARFFTV